MRWVGGRWSTCGVGCILSKPFNLTEPSIWLWFRFPLDPFSLRLPTLYGEVPYYFSKVILTIIYIVYKRIV